MAAHLQIPAFFSYSHHDERANPEIITAFTKSLEVLLNAKLTNADFFIWRDIDGIRTGDLWNSKIEDAIRESKIFILLLSPKWIESNYCRREYLLFCENVEKKRPIGEYVAPLLIREVEGQASHFNNDQALIYRSLRNRQYIKVLSKDFSKLSMADRAELIEKIADDIMGMIERLRSSPEINPSKFASERLRRSRALKSEFDARAHNFENVDFVSEAEVLVEKAGDCQTRAIFAQIGFIPRMYVQSTNARVEFAIRRAFLTLSDGDCDGLRKNEEWADSTRQSSTAYYVTFRDSPSSITVCMDSDHMSLGLGELSLPPAEGENRLARIAYLSPNVALSSLSASLSISLSVEGLHIFTREDAVAVPSTLAKKVAAIITVAAEKGLSGKKSVLERQLPIRERKR